MTVVRISDETNSQAFQRALTWHAGVPVAILLLAQVALYIWLAPRGFDFTDEAFYFLHYLYWRDLSATISFFGAYFDLPFRMLDQSVSAIRNLSLLLLLTSSAFLTREALRFSGRRHGTGEPAPWSFLLVGTAASLFYFSHLTTLRAPSYNLLALCSMLLASGVLLRVLEPENLMRPPRLAMFCYGLAVGACGLGKPTSGAFLVLCHLFFFALANRDWRPQHLLVLAALSSLGVATNFALLQLAHPQWLTALREGLAVTATTDHRNVFELANVLRWQIQQSVRLVLPWTAMALLVLVLFRRSLGPTHRALASIVVGAVILGSSIGLISQDWKELWLPLLGAGVVLLLSIEALSREPRRLAPSDPTELALMGLLVALPLAFSFGTNMLVLEHRKMAAVFPIVALSLRLLRLYRLRIVSRPVLVASLAALCMPTLILQIDAAVDVRHTYRQLAALRDQTLPVQLGGTNTPLLVGEKAHKSLTSVIDAARAAGFESGQPILDFTGDGPGWVYALGGRPLGVAWLLGGYPGSDVTAAHLISRLPRHELRRAWILSSAHNPRSIMRWEAMLHERLGPQTHERVVTLDVPAPYRWRPESPEISDLQLWRPIVSPRP